MTVKEKLEKKVFEQFDIIWEKYRGENLEVTAEQYGTLVDELGFRLSELSDLIYEGKFQAVFECLTEYNEKGILASVRDGERVNYTTLEMFQEENLRTDVIRFF